MALEDAEKAVVLKGSGFSRSVSAIKSMWL
jgi:hypothetical protein